METNMIWTYKGADFGFFSTDFEMPLKRKTQNHREKKKEDQFRYGGVNCLNVWC